MADITELANLALMVARDPETIAYLKSIIAEKEKVTN